MNSVELQKLAISYKNDASLESELLKGFLSVVIEEFDNGGISWETRDIAEIILKSL